MIKLRYVLICLCLFAGKNLLAQDQVVHNWASGADQNDWSWGFTFQYVRTDFKIAKKPDWRSPYYDPTTGQKLTDSLNSISSKPSSGFAIGFITRYRLTDHVEARLTPMLLFADRLLRYEYNSPSANPLLTTRDRTVEPTILEQQVQSTVVEFPLSMKLKSDRLGNFRAYLLGGLKYSMLISSKKNADNISPIDKVVRNVGGYASYEAGIGCDIYFEFFKLSPEIKISNSFKNMLVADNTPYSRPIDKLFLHTLMISLYFE
ncbi:outer membrane beta-barrel protein [Mucilaginibacter mali]|uniref:Outer membrane beta-barrel protein n=1 Tax=Mucilaginibacter mali TaxID=2740462 RepID=A0A7D4UC97_9SPHI|nr:outer membrane beta-barrel protein [Mucilaginibacter mali]QKJ29099.1 outer membrane beta-barrel protein [Mucilaginibacter mali]